MFYRCRIIVFSKAPLPGITKSRLVPYLGAGGATQLHERMVRHTLSTAVDSRVGSVELWCTPSTSHPFFRSCEEHVDLSLRLQCRGSIGTRMAHAFRQTLQASAFALLVGTDCPSRTQDDLREAVRALRQGADAVLGPTEDGGYSLIGLRQCAPELFRRVSWGTELVLEQTRARLRTLRWTWHELAFRWDVDRPQDVQRLKSEGYFLADFARWEARGNKG